MNAPASIHEPVTASQAKYLPAFFWNVRPDPKEAEALTRKERQQRHSHESYLRKKAAKESAQ